MFPGKIIDKYCSPTSKLIPTELKAVKAINLAIIHIAFNFIN